MYIAKEIDNATAAAALQGQVEIEQAIILAAQQRVDALTKAISDITDGYQSDQDAIAEAFNEKLDAAKMSVKGLATVSPVGEQLVK